MSQTKNTTEIAVTGTRDDPAATIGSPAQLLPIAVLVCHGMGQQVPFETLNAVVTALENHKTGNESCLVDAARVDFVAWEGAWIPRARVEVRCPSGPHQPVDLYEAYWAPLTEGVISLWQTLGFFLDAGCNGVGFTLHGHFDRFMFNRLRDFDIPPRAVFQLGIALAAFVWLSVAFALTGLIAASALLFAFRVPWPPKPVLATIMATTLGALTSTFSIALAGAIVSLGLLWTRRTEAPTIRDDAGQTPVSWSDVAARVLALILAIAVVFGGALEWWVSVSKWTPYFCERLPAIFLVTASLVLLFLALRYFLVEYAGDVAVYVAPYKVSRFATVRQSIQAVGRRVGRLVYAKNPPGAGVERYERVIVIGHSLGSVIAYDAINDMVNGGRVSRPPGLPDPPDTPTDAGDIARRTSVFLTFGSPLDKTAFIFRTQQPRRRVGVREELAAETQPIIVERSFRPQRWINIWSPSDWISGSLGYYDPPPSSESSQGNIVNLWERLPFLQHNPVSAHSEYWTRPLFRRILYDALTDTTAPVALIEGLARHR